MYRSRLARITALALLFSSGLSATLRAQSLYGADGAAGRVVEQTGPPDAVCGYPKGPILSSFPTSVAFGCPTATLVGPPPANFFGDIGVDEVADTVWVTDGTIVTEYAGSALPGIAPGAPLRSYLPFRPTALPITGMSVDPVAGLVWFTDAVFVWAETPPPRPGCGMTGTLVVTPWVLTLSFGPARDVEWDPVFGTLFVCDIGGGVTNYTTTGALGPFGFFIAAPGICGLSMDLQGVALDTVGTQGLGFPVLYITDGFTVSYVLAGGAPAPATFHSPSNCFPAGGSLLGLATAERALPYGSGKDKAGLSAPLIGSVGQAISPNPGFTTTLTQSVPGGIAGLFFSPAGSTCPPLVVAGLPVYLDPSQGLQLFGPVVVDALGNASLSTPLPAGFPPGTSAWVQWVVSTPNPSLQVSGGLAVTIGTP